jgi:hypothetical protein
VGAKYQTIAADKPAMARKYTKTAAKRRPLKSSQKPIGIVVRHGALRRFDQLTRKTAELPVVVSWDRRQADRRPPSRQGEKTDQRKAERRKEPPFTWEVADFVVLDCAPQKLAFHT